MTLANRLTLLRIACIPLVIVALFYGLNGLAAILFVLLTLSDVLDGYVARRLKEVSSLGMFLDPLADKILVITTLVFLVGQGKAHPVPVVIFLARDVVVSWLRVDSAKTHNKMFGASMIGKVKATAQFVAVPMLILSLPLAHGVLWLAVILSLVSGGSYLWQSKILKRLKLS